MNAPLDGRIPFQDFANRPIQFVVAKHPKTGALTLQRVFCIPKSKFRKLVHAWNFRSKEPIVFAVTETSDPDCRMYASSTDPSTL